MPCQDGLRSSSFTLWGALSNLCYSHIRSWNVLLFYIYFRIIDVDIAIVDWFHRKNFYLRLCSFFLKYIFSVFFNCLLLANYFRFPLSCKVIMLLPFLSFSSIQSFTVRNFLSVCVLNISFHFLQAFIGNVETSSLTNLLSFLNVIIYTAFWELNFLFIFGHLKFYSYVWAWISSFYAYATFHFSLTYFL